MLKPLLQSLTLIATALLLITAIACTDPDSGSKQYSMEQLNAWIETVRDAVEDVPVSSGPSIGSRNPNDENLRIILSAFPLRGARKQMEAAISTVDVPRDAIYLEVGCENPELPSIYPRIFANEPFLDSMKYSLEVPSQASYGETVPLKLTLENVSDETAGLKIGGHIPEDFVITTQDGKGIWYWHCGRFDYDAIYGLYLEPGEKTEFVEEWQQVNHRGEPVPPGEYLVYGIMIIGSLEQPGRDLFQLETKPQRLQILKP